MDVGATPTTFDLNKIEVTARSENLSVSATASHLPVLREGADRDEVSRGLQTCLIDGGLNSLILFIAAVRAAIRIWLVRNPKYFVE